MSQRQLTNAGGSYRAAQTARSNATTALDIVAAIPKEVLSVSPAAYIQTVLPQITQARRWMEWAERILIEAGSDAGVSQRRLGELSNRPASTVGRWNDAPLMDSGEPGAYGPEAQA